LHGEGTIGYLCLRDGWKRKKHFGKKLAERYGLKYYSGGDALKALALEKGHKPAEHGWWESREGLSFLEKREKNPEFDRAVDQKLLEVAKQGNVVLDSWTMPWLLEMVLRYGLKHRLEKGLKGWRKETRYH
jgi:cytidylate kinase